MRGRQKKKEAKKVCKQKLIKLTVKNSYTKIHCKQVTIKSCSISWYLVTLWQVRLSSYYSIENIEKSQ